MEQPAPAGGRADAEPFWAELSARLRAAKLTFGGRVHCPFLRPLFLHAADVARITHVAEAIAAIGERVVQAALADHSLFDARRPDRRRAAAGSHRSRLLAREHRVAARRVPAAGCPVFAEYNAESPAGLGYTETLARIFNDLPRDGAVSASRSTPTTSGSVMPSSTRCSPAIASGAARRALRRSLIVDFRGVPTWSEFEILQNRFEAPGVPTVVADPRDLRSSTAG